MRRVFRSSTSAKILLGCYLALPVVLFAIPRRWVSEGPTFCLWKNIFGTECYGCGMTRALFAALHFDFAAAWGYNRLVVVIAPILLYLYLKEIIRIKKRL